MKINQIFTSRKFPMVSFDDKGIWITTDKMTVIHSESPSTLKKQMEGGVLPDDMSDEHVSRIIDRVFRLQNRRNDRKEVNFRPVVLSACILSCAILVAPNLVTLSVTPVGCDAGAAPSVEAQAIISGAQEKAAQLQATVDSFEAGTPSKDAPKFEQTYEFGYSQ